MLAIQRSISLSLPFSFSLFAFERRVGGHGKNLCFARRFRVSSWLIRGFVFG